MKQLNIRYVHKICISMGEKVSLEMLNSASNNGFSDLASVYLKVFDH